jgi:polyisoprenoid-binding protein YceI
VSGVTRASRTFLACCAAAPLLFAQPVQAAPAAIDVQRSTLTVHVFKQGVFAVFADNHDIAAPIESGAFDGAAKTVSFSINAAQLKVLDPKLSPGRRGEVQAAMSGPQVLDVGRYPTIAFTSETIEETDATHWVVTGTLLLHGQRHRIAVRVQRVDETHFNGSAAIRQTVFGIRPIRVAGGTVAVKDDVGVDFQIALVPLEAARRERDAQAPAPILPLPLRCRGRHVGLLAQRNLAGG